MSGVLRWEAPPPALAPLLRERTNGWQAVADELRNRPGEWAVVAERRNTSVAHHIRTGALSAFGPAGDFDATARCRNGQVTIYARYVGAERMEVAS